MLYIRAIFKNIYKNKLKNILNIFQLTISFLTIIILFGMIFNIKYKIDCVKEVVTLDTLKGYVGALPLEYDTEKDMYKIVPNYLNKIYAKQHEVNDVSFGRYQLTSIGKSQLLMIDDNLSEIINFKLDSGRLLTKEDFKNLNEGDTRAALVPYDLKEKYPIGHKFTVPDYLSEISYEVVGILDESNKFWISDDILVDEISNHIVVPSDRFQDNYSYLCKLPNNKDYKMTKNQIMNNVSSFNSDEFKIINDLDTIEGLLKGKFKEEILKIFFLGMFSIVLLVLVLIGIRSLFKLQMLKRKTEFGIHISIGATTKSILIIVVGEVILDLLVSFLLGFILFTSLKTYIMTSNAFIISLNIYIYSIIMVILITFMPTLFSLKKLIKCTPIELIRSNMQ